MGKIQLDEVQPGQEQPWTVGIVEPAATVGTINSTCLYYYLQGYRASNIWFYIKKLKNFPT